MLDISISGVGVLDKAMAIVGVVESAPSSLAELVEGTGLSRPTVHRLAQALEAHGILRRDGDGRFVLGVRLTVLGRAAQAAFPLVEVAEAHLADLRDATGESVQLYVRDGEFRRCVVALDSPRELRTIVPLGARLPLRVGSAGRLLAGTPPGRHGWLETVEEREAGVASVSASVSDPRGDVVAAVSVSGPLGRIGRSPGRRHGAAVVAAARRIEAALAFPAG